MTAVETSQLCVCVSERQCCWHCLFLRFGRARDACSTNSYIAVRLTSVARIDRQASTISPTSNAQRLLLLLRCARVVNLMLLTMISGNILYVVSMKLEEWRTLWYRIRSVVSCDGFLVSGLYCWYSTEKGIGLCTTLGALILGREHAKENE